jgi:hypothetical protein
MLNWIDRSYLRPRRATLYRQSIVDRLVYAPSLQENFRREDASDFLMGFGRRQSILDRNNIN